MDVKITKALINNYNGKSNKEMKDLSFEVFRSLERLVNEHDNFNLVKRTYDETGVRSMFFGKMHSSFGSLKYEVYQEGVKKGRLYIEFFAGFDEGYNKMVLSFYSDPSVLNDRDIVRELSNKFHSFVEEK